MSGDRQSVGSPHKGSSSLPSSSLQSTSSTLSSNKLASKSSQDVKPSELSSNDEERIEFRCENCDMNELCDYKGKNPSFVNGIRFAEDCFVMRDPFSSPPFRSRSKPEYFIVLGADCTLCGRTVCKRSKCSAFYERTFCRDCATANLAKFPIEIQVKFKKQLAN